MRLLERGDKPAADLARELGIRRNQIYKWKEQLQAKGGEQVFPGHGRRAGREAEFVKLQRENARLREENIILKKSAVYFARESS